MLTPPDFFAQSSVGRFAHSALPGAPVRQPRTPRYRLALAAVTRAAGRRSR